MEFNDWCMEIDPPMWEVADFECMNKAVDDDQVDSKKLFVNKPVAISYVIVKGSFYDKLNLEKDGYYKKIWWRSCRMICKFDVRNWDIEEEVFQKWSKIKS